MKQIEIYGNTGFNSIDLPDSLQLVRENATLIKKLFNYNLIQTNNLATITVKGLTELECKKIDYVIIAEGTNQTGYILQDSKYEFRADGIIKLYLLRDAVGTIGIIEDDELIYGSANRMSVSDDDDTYYTDIEPFKPSEKSQIFESIMGRALDPYMSKEVYNILETVVCPPQKVESILGSGNPTWLQESEHVAEVNTGTNIKTDSGEYVMISGASNAVQAGTNTGEQVTIVKNKESDEVIGVTKSVLITPQFRKIIQTVYSISELFSKLISTIKTGTMWWNADNMETEFTTQDGQIVKCGVLRDLRTSGAENGAVAFWAVNKNYVEAMTDLGYIANAEDAGGIRAIKNKTYNDTAYYEPQIEYKNNKIGYGQAITLKIFSPISGNEITKQGYEIRNPDIRPSDRMTRADYSISADIRSGGCPVFAWKYINGEDQTLSFVETIKGGQWRQIPLAAVGNVGGDYEQITLNKEKNKKWQEVLMSALAQGSAAATGVAMTANPYIIGGAFAVGAVTAGAGTYISQTRKQTEQQAMLDAAGEVAGVAIQISTSEYLREIGKNTFYDLFICYSNEDMKNFDKFLTLYGYKVNNKTITANDLYSRPSFNYLRVNELKLKMDRFGIGLVEEAADQFKSGIRLWHEMPNQEAIANGNK